MKLLQYLGIFILMTVLQPQISHAQGKWRSSCFLRKHHKALQKIENISYKSTISYTNQAQKDTILFHAFLRYQKDKHDVFYGYKLDIDIPEALESYYSLGKWYRINKIGKNILYKRLLDPKITPITLGPFHEGIQDEHFADFLKNTDYFQQLQSNDSIQIIWDTKGFLQDTIQITIEYKHIVVKENTDTIWGLKQKYFFNRKSKFPILIQENGVGKFGVYQKTQSFNEVRFNQESTDHFFLKFEIPKDYQIIGGNPVYTHDVHGNTKAIKAPAFKLLNMNEDSIALEDYKGKVVLLDFWFSTCAPCIKASFYLDDLYQEYQDSGLVILGMNPKDGLELMRKHYKKWGNHYPSVQCTPEVQQAYDVSSFPTFILINQEGKIIHIDSGYSIAKLQKIKAIIQHQLNPN